MTINWIDKNSASLILEELEQIKTIDENKNVHFHGFGFLSLTPLLYNMIDFPKNISEIDARNIVTESVQNIGKKGKISPEKLLTEIRKLEKDYWLHPIIRYVLVTTVSIHKSIKLNRVQLGKNVILFESELPKKYKSADRDDLISQASKFLNNKPSKNYSYARIFVSSRSIYDAVNQALDDLNFIRGIWNYIINSSYSFRKTWGGNPTSINKIILGPIHTLHKNNGDLAIKNQWWYEPNYSEPNKSYTPNENDLSTLINGVGFIRKKIKNLSYSEDIKSAFIRYTRALDESDITSAFQKLWGVLEFLTDTTNSRYEVTIRRAASLYKERDFHLQTLGVIRDYRNSYIHFDKVTTELEIYLVKLKNYVEQIMKFHLTSQYRFKSISEVAEYFDIPTKKEDLEKKLKLYNFAKRFRHY